MSATGAEHVTPANPPKYSDMSMPLYNHVPCLTDALDLSMWTLLAYFLSLSPMSGPLPESESMTYLFTIVDQYTGWAEAIPMAGCSTETCIKGFLRHWIARFGIPGDVTSDRGPQFTSELWTELNRLLGISASNTTAYHPQANSLVERMHWQLKASLKARLTGPKWMDELPIVLLGI